MAYMDMIIACHPKKRYHARFPTRKWDEILQILSFFGQPRVEKSRAEETRYPKYQDPVSIYRLGCFVGLILLNFNFSRFTVPGRNSMSPPNLSADTPVVQVFHPMKISLLKRSGTISLFSFNNINGSLFQRDFLSLAE